MAIIDTIQETKSTLEEIKRKYRFRKDRMAHKDAVELQVTLTKCRGKLEICKKDFNRAIKAQSRNINNGRQIGADTLIQEQILWDAALGYMLVRDAIFALETITSYDAVSHAYEMLDAAVKQMSGKKSALSSFKVGSTKERNSYGYITSATAQKEKEEQLDSFFEALKLDGDIEAHLANARIPGATNAELRHAYTSNGGSSSDSELDEYMARLSEVPDEQTAPANFEQNMDAMLDIHPPKDSL
jgi:hypothetical protein